MSDDMVLGYHVCRETWYQRTYQQVTGQPHDEVVLMIGLYSIPTGGACTWEFAITEEQIGGTTLRVRVFDEAWQAFADVPEFFAGLADLGRGATIEQVVHLMNRLGFHDFTQRTNPHATPTT